MALLQHDDVRTQRNTITSQAEWNLFRKKCLSVIQSELKHDLLSYEKDAIIYQEVCQGCFKTTIPMLPCDKCFIVSFCSHCREKNPQVLQEHKKYCGAF